jgi:hypothetical protein
MAFSVLVEILNLRLSGKSKANPVQLHEPMLNEGTAHVAAKLTGDTPQRQA